MTTTKILARCLTPGDVFQKQTVRGGLVTYLVLSVETFDGQTVVYSLREYAGMVANFDRTYQADELLTFRQDGD